MLLETHLAQKTLGHAYYIEGNAENYIKNLFRPPAFEVLAYAGKTGIGEVRTILQKVSLASSEEKRQIVLINGDFLAWQARSALLKIIEEPPKYTHFIIYGASKKGLMPALASRLLDGGRIEETSPNPYKKKAEAFLKIKADPKKREQLIETIGDSESLAAFIQSIEETLRETYTEKDIRAYERIHTARALLSHPAPLISFIKDYLSLLL